MATVGTLTALAVAVVGFGAAWTGGHLVLDGPGNIVWLDMARENFLSGGLSYWVPNLFSGTPAWVLSPPTVTHFPLLPLAAAIGPEGATKAATLAYQVLGAWGTYVFARSLWRQQAPAALAGLVYGLHPYIVSHAILGGHYPATVVAGITPWFAWSLRKALRGDGPQYIGLTALIGAVAAVSQGELAYGLALLALCLLAVRLAGARRGVDGPYSRMAVLVRTGVVAALGLGLVAHWLFPLARLSDSFVLTPPDEARDVLVHGIGGAVGREPGMILSRSEGLSGVVQLGHIPLDGTLLYITWVCLILTLLTIFLLKKHDHDGTLTAVLFASAIGIWMQTGGVPLVDSNLASSVKIVPFVLIGIVAGVLMGSFLRRVRPGSSGVLGGILTALFLTALPYVAPFTTLQRIVPMLESVRWPRLYAISILGLALGAAYPLVALGRWAAAQHKRLAGLFTAAACLFVAGAFAVDIHPYRSFYFLDGPDFGGAYGDAVKQVNASGIATRVGASLEPGDYEPLLDAGLLLNTGWPHPLASKDLSRVTADPALSAPSGYFDAATGLSSMSHLATDRWLITDADVPVLTEVAVTPNPRVLPIVRAYEQAVVAADSEVTAELATALAQRNIGVVTGGSSAAERLGTLPRQEVGPKPCDRSTGGDGPLAGDVAMACALHRWIGVEYEDPVDIGQAPVGAVFDAAANGLRGIGVKLDHGEGLSELNLREIDAAGQPVGDNVVSDVRVSGTDFNGLPMFVFDPIPDSAGKRYQFWVSCGLCPPEDQPKMDVVAAERAPGNLVVEGRLDGSKVAAFSLLHEQLPAASPAETTIDANREGPGRWRITTTGPRPALVVVAESWFPGWQATVDGKSVPVLKADSAFLGIPVEPGQHVITLQYRTPGIVSGIVVSAISVVIAAVLVIAGVRGSRRRRQLGPTRAYRPLLQRSSGNGNGRGEPVPRREPTGPTRSSAD